MEVFSDILRHDTSTKSQEERIAAGKQAIAEMEELMAACGLDPNKSRGWAPSLQSGLEIEAESKSLNQWRPRTNGRDAENDERHKRRRQKEGRSSSKNVPLDSTHGRCVEPGSRRVQRVTRKLDHCQPAPGGQSDSRQSFAKKMV